MEVTTTEFASRSGLLAGFEPAVLWNRRFRERVAAAGGGEPFAISLGRPDGSKSVYRTEISGGDGGDERAADVRYVERLLKFLLWQKGGCEVVLGGDVAVGEAVAAHYRQGGERDFDVGMMGGKIYRRAFALKVVADADAVPAEAESSVALGGHLDGCRIGFDLGGSDRKCAAVIDGKVVFSEEVVWDPYFQSDPDYHLAGIEDSLKRAAAHLPRVDAIGGSAAGVYVENEVRAGSLFRGVPEDVFEARVRRLFFDVQERWGGVPFVVVNDGDVTALAGAMATGATGVLGVAMGTSEAAGYVTTSGRLTNWLNELAFAPVDYAPGAPVDEWAGDAGCGVQYLSQQATGRLAVQAGIEFEEGVGLPEKLVEVQRLVDGGDVRAREIFETVGTYFGYAVAHYSDFYDVNEVLALGRVTSGAGGEILLERARAVLDAEFPEVAERVSFRTPGEQEKRHGQAIAAASLASI